MKSANDYKFDAVAIFDRYGGIGAVGRLLTDAGIKVDERTLRKQKERGVMPSHILASIMFASHKAGIPIDYSEFLMERENER